MRRILNLKTLVSELADAARAFADACNASDDMPPGLTRTHRSEIASTLASRRVAEFGKFVALWRVGRIEQAMQIASDVVSAELASDPDLFSAAPTPAELVKAQIADLKARGCTPDATSLKGSSEFCTEDDRRHRFYTARESLAATTAKKMEAA